MPFDESRNDEERVLSVERNNCMEIVQLLVKLN